MRKALLDLLDEMRELFKEFSGEPKRRIPQVDIERMRALANAPKEEK